MGGRDHELCRPHGMWRSHGLPRAHGRYRWAPAVACLSAIPRAAAITWVAAIARARRPPIGGGLLVGVVPRLPLCGWRVVRRAWLSLCGMPAAIAAPRRGRYKFMVDIRRGSDWKQVVGLRSSFAVVVWTCFDFTLIDIHTCSRRRRGNPEDGTINNREMQNLRPSVASVWLRRGNYVKHGFRGRGGSEEAKRCLRRCAMQVGPCQTLAHFYPDDASTQVGHLLGIHSTLVRHSSIKKPVDFDKSLTVFDTIDCFKTSSIRLHRRWVRSVRPVRPHG